MGRGAAFALLVLAGCATGEGLAPQSLVGLSEYDVVSRFGPPHQSHDVGDARFLSWTEVRRFAQPGWVAAPRRSMFLDMPIPGSSRYGQPMVVERHCTLLLELGLVEQPPATTGAAARSAYVVQSARRSGDGC